MCGVYSEFTSFEMPAWGGRKQPLRNLCWRVWTLSYRLCSAAFGDCDKMPERITFQGRKVCHSSWYWSFQLIGPWPYRFGPVMRGYIMVGVCVGRNLFMVARKQKEKEGAVVPIFPPRTHTRRLLSIRPCLLKGYATSCQVQNLKSSEL